MGDGDALLLTIRDASRATGLSVKAIRRRVERGTLPAQLVDGVRRVPMAELLRAGLMVTQADGPRPGASGGGGGDLAALTRRVAALEARVAELEAEHPAETEAETAPRALHPRPLTSLDDGAVAY
jgi:hypothetical protein